MKNHSLSPEEKADEVLSRFDGINAVDVPVDFDSKMFARFDSEFSTKSKTPKWFWAAALVILAVNVLAAFNYAGSSKVETSGMKNVASYYFTGGSDWYSQNN